MVQKEKEAQIHFTLPENLKRSWREKFEELGHKTMASGIKSAVFYYLNIQHWNTPHLDNLFEKIRKFSEYFEKIEMRLEENKIQIKEAMEEVKYVETDNYTKLKNILLEKIEMYQPISISFLSQVTQISGEILFPILKKMTNEHYIQLTEKGEWILFA